MAERHAYITPLKYVSGRIVEYDIRAANINMLRAAGVINNDYYSYLKALPKHDREKDIGLFIRSDSQIYQSIQTGIVNAKKKLFEANNVDINSILRIANDAVYINSPYDLRFIHFEDLEFVPKSISSAMMKLDDNTIAFLSVNGENLGIDIKGIGEIKLNLHEQFMCTFIANVMYLLQYVSPTDALQMVNEFYEDYVNLRLPLGYYREFNSISLYKIKYTQFYIGDESTITVNDIDISNNLAIIREIWGTVLELCKLR